MSSRRSLIVRRWFTFLITRGIFSHNYFITTDIALFSLFSSVCHIVHELVFSLFALSLVEKVDSREPVSISASPFFLALSYFVPCVCSEARFATFLVFFLSSDYSIRNTIKTIDADLTLHLAKIAKSSIFCSKTKMAALFHLVSS